MNPAKTIETYKSNAKLMISGEYLVLRGAEALAIPLKFGQTLKVCEHSGKPLLAWKTIVIGQHWFDAVFSLDEFVIGNTNDFPTAQNLREILMAARKIQPGFLKKNNKYEAVSELDFDISWGLGSSSSLIVNIANWAGIDPFVLFEKVSVGSGYDLAAAMAAKPILYTLKEGKREIKEVDFYPGFHHQIYFTYLGKKRNSAQAVMNFKELPEKDLANKIHDINAITQAMLTAVELREFRKLMRDHEKIISGVLGVPPLSYKTLSDFNGDMKSLGAWGGDFIMLATDMSREYVVSWLRKKEMNVWFTYEDIAIKPFTAT
jgi:mevalonate kinase